MTLRKPSAQALDRAAAALHRAGTRIAGTPGGRVGDAIANTTLAPLRRRHDQHCTCSQPDCDA